MIEAELDTEKAGETEGEARGHGDMERKRLGVWGTWDGEEEDDDEEEEARGERVKGEGLVVWMGDFSKSPTQISTSLQIRALIEPTNAGQTPRRTIRKKRVTPMQSPATRSLIPRATTCTFWIPASY
jgi:hypothetical protein